MAIGVNTNISGSTYLAINGLTAINQALGQSLTRVETGNKILRASDNPSGLVKVLELDADINADQTQLESNQEAAADLTSVDDALTSVLAYFQDMNDLVDQWENAAAGSQERTDIETTLNTISAQLDEIATNTDFNDEAVLGADNGAKTIRWGTSASDTAGITFADLRESAIDLDAQGAGVDFNAGLLASPANVRTAISTARTSVENMARRLGQIQDSHLTPANNQLAGEIDALGQHRSVLMETDTVAESASIAMLQARRTNALNAMALQNELTRTNAINLFG